MIVFLPACVCVCVCLGGQRCRSGREHLLCGLQDVLEEVRAP